MKRMLAWVLLLLFLTTGCAVQPPHGEPPPGDGQPPLEPQCTVSGRYQVTFCSDTSLIANPERGFHTDVQLVNVSRIEVATDITLVRSYVRLDNWRESDLPAQLLNDLDRGFGVVRAAGLKVIPRFTYNFGEEPDAPLTWVLRHIEQLTPVLQANSDVIAVLQAGFIGRWGEWHHSEYGLATRENKRIIAEALLAALPSDRMVQIRTPFHIRDVLGDNDLFDPGEAFSATDQARLGFVNDCFLSGIDDVGTYPNSLDRPYARAMAPFTVTGGETCEHDSFEARQECPNTLSELAEYHWDYLNLGYHPDVLQGWRAGGCFDQIRLRLGYRFELLGASLESQPGSDPVLTIGIRNTGFGKLYNPRPLELVLVNGSDRRRVELVADARNVLPLAGETIDSLSFTLSDLPVGNWQLELALPDDAESLRSNPAYSIRLASLTSTGSSIWTSSGTNRLGLSLQVTPD